MTSPERLSDGAPVDGDGPLWAAILASGIGAFAMGLVALLNEAGVFSAPSIYGPSGGVSGRTTLAVVAWLASWAVLHRRWKDRSVAGRRILATTLALIALGLLGAFPPVWAIF